MPQAMNIGIAALAAFAGVTGIVSAAPAPLSPAQYAAAIDAASRQGIVSQKFAKEFFLLAAGVEVERNRANLADSLRRFEQTLVALDAGDSRSNIPSVRNGSLDRHLDETIQIWDGIKPTLQAAVNGNRIDRADIQAVAIANLTLLASCERLAGSLRNQAGESVAQASTEATLALRQGLIGQQMAKEFVLVHLNYDADANRQNLRDNTVRFDSFLGALSRGDTLLDVDRSSDRAVSAQLEQVRQQWTSFKSLTQRAVDGRPTASDVAAVSALSDSLLGQAGNTFAAITNAQSRGTFTAVDTNK